MRQVHCDGCGFAESDNLLKSERKIGPVVLQLGPEPRWAGDQKEVYKADLCEACLALLLHTYFKVPMNERLQLAVPTFIVPNSLEDVPEPQSLKA